MEKNNKFKNKLKLDDIKFGKIPNELLILNEAIISLNGECRLVGGAVRDLLLDNQIGDFDIATNLLPKEMMQINNDIKWKSKIKIIDIAADHGTVMAIINKQAFEITTLRQEIEWDGRKAKVIFTNDFKLDSLRRDFTINAISLDLNTGDIYDYHGGIDDLNNHIVKFIGNPEKRIIEDHLRILRFFRFSAIFARHIDEDGFNACIKHKDKILLLSKERIKSELDKILINYYIRSSKIDSLSLLYENNILSKLLNIDFFDIKSINKFNNSFNKIKKELGSELIGIFDQIDIQEILTIYYCIIFITDYQYKQTNLVSYRKLINLKFSSKQAKNILSKFESIYILSNDNENKLTTKLTTKFKNHILLKAYNYIENYSKNSQKSDQEFDTNLNHDYKYDFLLYRLYLTKEEDKRILDDILINLYKKFTNDKLILFPINGNDIINIKQNIQGKELKNLLSELKILWIESDFTLNKNELLAKIS